MAFDTADLPQPPDARGWAFVEGFTSEPPAMRAAREQSAELRSASVSPALGATLKFFVELLGAHNVVEFGTSTGGATLWLASGLSAAGQITSLDTDGEHQKIARGLSIEAGIPSHQLRLINGRAADVAPRLTEHGYDIAVLNAVSIELDALHEPAIRLLRDQGLLLLPNAFGGGKVGDPAQRDRDSVARRLFVQKLGADPRLRCVLLPVGDGLLAATLTDRQAANP